MLLVLALAMVALFWWSGRTRRKQESKRREMLSCLKKGDKVTTIGGIVGTLMEVREDEVVLKIDENSNTRIHMARWAVRGVGEEARKQAPEEHR
jgi:preprotein translocase subunit YajC